MHNLVCFGVGYTCNFLINNLYEYNITAIKRKIENVKNYKNIKFIEFDKLINLPKNTTHILISIPPINGNDIIFEKFYQDIVKLKNLKWIGYLSSTGVYGDHKGNWVDENSALNSLYERSINRLKAESNWINLYNKYQIPTVIFRLSGIYGPTRNPVEKILFGEKIPIISSPGKLFSRINVLDLINILSLSMKRPTPGEIFNVSDDLPEENSKVTKYAYDLLNIKPEIYQNICDIKSEMLREFYLENKKVSNLKIKNKLDIKLEYPTYIEGLNNIKNNL